MTLRPVAVLFVSLVSIGTLLIHPLASIGQTTAPALPPPSAATLDPSTAPAISPGPTSVSEAKLATALRQASAAHAADPAAWQEALNPAALQIVDDRILVEIALEGAQADAVTSQLQAGGGTLRNHNVPGLVEAWVRVGQLASLASRTDVRQIRPALLVRPAAGATESEGVAVANADLWHAAGFDGAGTTIANIDTGYTGFAARQATGDWPTGTQLVTVDLDGEGFGTNSPPDDHGTSTLEINFDVAPGASYVAYEVSTRGDWVAALNDAIARGVDVVSASLTQPLDGVGDGSACPPNVPVGCGSVAEAVAAARAAGILVVNAAGNERMRHWGGLYQPFSGDASFHDFGGGANINTTGTACYAVGSAIRAELFWDDWTNVDHDYSLQLYQVNAAGTGYNLVAASNATQSGLPASQLPQEFIQYEITSSSGNCPAGFAYLATAVRRVNAPTHRNLQLFVGYDLNIQVHERSLVFPADSPDLITVAAVDVDTLAQEPFSSEGPVLGPGGSLAASSIPKPDVTSTDDVSTETTAPGTFVGTSGSTPHVAGLAALLKDKHPGYGVGTLASQVRMRAAQNDLGPVGFDTQHGEGLLALTDLPEVAVTADGNPVEGEIVVADGTTIQFQTTASDDDGLGYPVFAFLGNNSLVKYIWTLDGATVPGPLWNFHPSPPVTFDLPPGETTRTYDVSVQVWDTTGEWTTFPITVTVTEPPEVSVNAGGIPVTGPLSVTSGTTVQFQTIASDENGLGYPVFAFLGNNTLIKYIWNLDGASVPGPLWNFHPSPPVTFTLDPGETARTFDVSVTVYDTLGISTTFPIQVDVTQ